ncbi:MAG: putative lipid II flippase FtsW [bacterium]
MSAQHAKQTRSGVGAGERAPARPASDPGRSRGREAAADRRGLRPGAKLKDSSLASYHLVWVTALLLLIAGLCMMLSVSVATAVTGGDKFAYIRQQGITAGVGLLLLLGISRFDYRRIRMPSVFFVIAVMFSLLLIHLPGVSQSEGGSASWIPLGPLTFQPSEFAKLAVVLAAAQLLSDRRRQIGDFASFMWPFGAIGLSACVLVVFEGDLGTAIIIAGLVLGLLWLGGMKGRHWALVAGAGGAAALAFTFSSHERMSRVLSFLDPSADPQGSSFQLSQSLVALGRGGWFGVGPGESVQKFQYLPKAHTDMIYAILGEEFGLLGAGLVILLFAVFALACWQLARRCADPVGRYLIAGCGMLVTLQAVVNIGGVTGALPLTGVPLPFISYGRNSLIVMLIAVGLILSVSRSAPLRPVRAFTEAYGNVTNIDRRRRDRGARRSGAGAG